MDWVLITGASRGIGAGVAKRLASKGLNLVLWSRTESELEQVAKDCRSLGAIVNTAVVDVADSDSVTTSGVASLDGIEVLRGCIINAGSATFGNVPAFSTEEWRAVIGTNLDGTFFTLRTALPLLEKSPFSQVVAMGSQSGLFGFAEQAGYNASKWGLHGLVETVRRENRSNGVRVTNLVLGPVDTYFREKKPGDRPGTLSIDDVAGVVEFLFSIPLNVEVREIHLTSMLKPFGPFPEYTTHEVKKSCP
jgi:3-oxoacyl-[acyl-carrier protein] reductase